MDQSREERLRARAHAIWERKGRPEGQDDANWREAEAEIAQEEAGSPLANAERSVPDAEHVATGDGNPIAAHAEEASKPGYQPPRSPAEVLGSSR